jgi:2-keto-myo-inositol isomerase
VSVLKPLSALAAPQGIRLSLEFCRMPVMSINRFKDADAIVRQVGSPMVGLTLDEHRFHAMASSWDALEHADGSKIFVWHVNGMEDVRCGAPYKTHEKRLWPDAAGDCLDHARYAKTLKQHWKPRFADADDTKLPDRIVSEAR